MTLRTPLRACSKELYPQQLHQQVLNLVDDVFMCIRRCLDQNIWCGRPLAVKSTYGVCEVSHFMY